MKALLKHEKIYNSEELQAFFLSLEERYEIEDARERYHNLVNFSRNSEVPFHQWFKYREGFSGELIEELIEMSGAEKGDIIIDPFTGSGTTNVVAMLKGYSTLGLDANPMSAFIASVKTDCYSRKDIGKARSYLESLADFSEIIEKPAYEDIRKYFNENNFKELLRIKTYIDQLDESKAKNILLAGFISIVEICSDRKRDGNGLKKAPTKVSDVPAEFVAKVNLMLSDIAAEMDHDGVRGFGIYDTAFHLKDRFDECCQGKRAGVIIFSPPYANSFDYFESYKLELVFGDYADGLGGISELRKKAVRSFVGAGKQDECDIYVDALAREIEEAVPEKEKESGRRDSRTRKVPDMLRGYFYDMREVIHQCGLCLERGRKTYIVVDQSAYIGKIVPTDLLFGYLAEKEGFQVGKIIACRRTRTSTQQLRKYPYLKTAIRESIVELVKK